MRNKMYKTMSIMAVAGLLLTGCTSTDSPKSGGTPQPEENVDLTDFPELKPVKDNLKFHESFAYNAPNGTARRASMTIQEVPKAGYVERRLKTKIANDLASENNGKPASDSAVQKAMQSYIKEQAEKNVYFITNFSVEKIKDGADVNEPRQTDQRVYLQINQPCAQDTATMTHNPLYNIPYEDGCIISQSGDGLKDSSYREASIAWDSEISPFNYGDSSIRTDYVTRAGAGVALEATGEQQELTRDLTQAFAVYDLEGGGEPLENLPNFTCEPGTAGQAVLDAYNSVSEARGGIAKRYMMFAPEGSGCTRQSVPSADS
ncbi:hypothetical protein ACTXJX_14865 [Glutamicibacter ardleyensis]|uniref:hypothetical protein n=1 Tax=Glutamicibacter ardleyensis TaxID=225894 RepID=UPI003FCF2E21